MKKCVAYCRVSTNSEEQEESYLHQKQYFEELLTKQNGFELIDIYADKGTGTSFKREGFQKMLYDAGLDIEYKKGEINFYVSRREPKFNYIYVKENSRFARNIEVVSIIRKLKEKGVYIVFIDLSKNTENEEDTMMLQFFYSMAQEESRKISSRVKFGKYQAAKNGKIHLTGGIYGYECDFKSNALRAIPDEAEVIKLIYNLAEENNGVRKIKKYLDENGYSRNGKKFTEHFLLYALQNKKYCGYNIRNVYDKPDILNKYKQIKKDESEWIIEKSDRIDVIITEEQFNKVQELISRRRTHKPDGKSLGYKASKSDLAGKIICGECGGKYISNREVYSNGRVREFYNCNVKKKKGTKYCKNKNIDKIEIEVQIEVWRNGFYKKYFDSEREETIKKLILKQQEIENLKDLNKIKDIENIKNEISEYENKLSNLLDNMIEEQSDTLKRVYKNKIENMENEIKVLEEKLKALESSEQEREEKIKNINVFIEALNMKKMDVKEKMTREEFLEEADFVIKEGKIYTITKSHKFFNLINRIIKGDLSKIKQKKLEEIESLSKSISM